jgi:hypothetical protein
MKRKATRKHGAKVKKNEKTRGGAKKRTKRPMKTRPKATRARPGPRKGLEDRGEIVELAGELVSHPETGPVLTGGDIDADWTRAHLSGEEAVGGSVATPDQDIVDEIGRALGVEQAPDAQVRMSEEILRDRDHLKWHLDRDAAEVEDTKEEGRERPRTGRRTR